MKKENKVLLYNKIGIDLLLIKPMKLKKFYQIYPYNIMIMMMDFGTGTFKNNNKTINKLIYPYLDLTLNIEDKKYLFNYLILYIFYN